VHKGFWKAWESVENNVAKTLADMGCAAFPLVVTGHSLGAALASLAAYSLSQQHNFTLGHVYLFESPRVGNKNFVVEYQKRIASVVPSWRVTYGRDPVCLIPVTGFLHLNYEVYYTSSAEVVSCEGGEDPTCIAGHSLLVAKLHADDHCNVGYVDGINGICSASC
jgi:triacylglycerol lipase